MNNEDKEKLRLSVFILKGALSSIQTVLDTIYEILNIEEREQ